ncbi:MAG TPA: FIST N-terminal domain-containing protein, partial [Gaiellaceae bacterium]|nr:FIST N-terminal domain-containing protein [Gaiellaceae bacterium]
MSTDRWVSVGQSTGTDSYAAGIEAATLAVAGRSAALLIVFCSNTHDLARLLAGINETSGGAPLIGCSTAGEIATGGPADLSVVVTALGGEGFSVATSSSPLDGDRLSEGGAAVAACLS